MGESSTVFRWRTAAFDGLRLVMGNAPSLLVWWLLALVATYAVVAVGYLLGLQWDSYVLLFANTRFVTVALVPVLTVVGAVLCCAVYRAALEPEDSRFAYLRLGRPELRMIALFAVLAVGVTAAWLAGLALGPRGFVTLLVGFALLCRVGLLAPAIFRDRRFNLKTAWRLGGEWYWNILGLNLLTSALFIFGVGGASFLWRLFIQANWQALTVEGDWPLLLMGKLFAISALMILVYTATFAAVVAPGIRVYCELVTDPDPDAEPMAEVFD